MERGNADTLCETLTRLAGDDQKAVKTTAFDQRTEKGSTHFVVTSTTVPARKTLLWLLVRSVQPPAVGSKTELYEPMDCTSVLSATYSMLRPF